MDETVVRRGKGKKAVNQEKKNAICSALPDVMQSSNTLTPPQSAALIITTELNHSLTKNGSLQVSQKEC